MLGPKGVAFDNDEILDDNDDEDLKNDPISQMDMQVSVQLTVGYKRILIFLHRLTWSTFSETALHETSPISIRSRTNSLRRSCSSFAVPLEASEASNTYDNVVYYTAQKSCVFS